MNYGRHSIDNSDIKAVSKTLRSDYLTCGPKVEEFEEKIAEYCNAKYAVAVSNGTAALYLLAKILNRHVVIPDITFMATANAFKLNRNRVILKDVDKYQPIISNYDSELLYVPVHMMGYPVLMNRFDKNNTIEDACHALGATWQHKDKWHKVGDCLFSKATVFSMHAIKGITTGEGGIITTNDESLYLHLKQLRNHGIINNSYDINEISLNFRLSDINASLGISQLKRIDKFIERRNEIVELYNKLLPEFCILPSKFQRPSYHLYCIRVNPLYRDNLKKKLFDIGINCQIHYRPLHTLEPYKAKHEDFKNSLDWYNSSLSLPIYYDLTDKEVKFVAKSIRNILQELSS